MAMQTSIIITPLVAAIQALLDASPITSAEASPIPTEAVRFLVQESVHGEVQTVTGSLVLGSRTYAGSPGPSSSPSAFVFSCEIVVLTLGSISFVFFFVHLLR